MTNQRIENAAIILRAQGREDLAADLVKRGDMSPCAARYLAPERAAEMIEAAYYTDRTRP